MSIQIPFENTYTDLPDRFFTRLDPTPVASPSLFRLNTALASELGLDPAVLATPEGVSFLAGNTVPSRSRPIAQVYAGHQFGGWSPRLGDGRAILLGEVRGANGTLFDIQLKGSGPTPYSRMGDGRAWLGPVLREYIVSEAMAALGIPTTRALAAVTTGETVLREAPLPGAVLTRVARSHIRVGTFQYFASQQDSEALSRLVDYTIARHASDANGPLDLLKYVIEKQANLIAAWMGVGFIHGVMNTDNMTVSGETIDYGPCAFMDAYHPMRVFSSIDAQGRYAFARQPDMALWNLAQLATALLPIMNEDREAAVAQAQSAIDGFPEIFQNAWAKVFSAKVGIATATEADIVLIHELLDLMAKGGSDFTNTFRGLAGSEARNEFADRDAFDAWDTKWRARLAKDGTTPEEQAAAMAKVNPAVIPRTHRIEEAIAAAIRGDKAPFEALHVALSTPFTEPEATELMRPPSAEEVVPQTFCGT